MPTALAPLPASPLAVLSPALPSRFPLEETSPDMAPREHAGERPRVLIVEDNPDGAEALRLLLQLLGYEARVASPGPEGVLLAQQWRPPVVLCDIGLPGLSDYGVAEALRRSPATGKARLIAI